MRSHRKYARPSKPDQVNERDDPAKVVDNNNVNDEPKKRPDWWSRVDIMTKIISGIVIAAAGIGLTWYLQKSQLDAQKAKAENDKKLEEGRITAQLVQHLTSNDPKQKELAIIALKTSVPQVTFDSMMEVLAKTDPDENVRKAAIEQIGKSNAPKVPEALTTIGSDEKRAPAEKKAVQEAIQRAAIGTVVTSDTYAFAASANTAIDKGVNGLFTYYLLKGLNGEADINKDDNIAANELQEYLSSQVNNDFNRKTGAVSRGVGGDIKVVNTRQSKTSPYSPITAFEGSGDVAIWGRRADYGRIVALIIAADQYSDKRIEALPFTINDANGMNEIIKKDKRAKTQLLINPKKDDVIEAMEQLKASLRRDDLLIVYFSGHGKLGKDGIPGWLLSDSNIDNESTYLSLNIVKNFLDQVQVKTKTLYIDACFSRVGELFGR